MKDKPKTRDNMRQFMQAQMRDCFDSIDNKQDAFEAIHWLHNRISKIIQGLAERGVLTEREALDYSFSACACAAFVYALEHNPVFDQGVFKDQLIHHYQNVMDAATDTPIRPDKVGVGE